ncbi:MAG: hypothetical protein AAF490_06570 [Chloroflexota bacterium]
MNKNHFFFLSGIACIAAGVFFIADTVADFIIPNNSFGLGIWVSFLGLHGLTALYFLQREHGGYLNLAGYLLNFTGLAGLIGVGFVNNFILPNIETSVTQQLLSGPLLPIFITVGVVYLTGALLFGVAIWRGRIIKPYAAILYMLGSIPVALPPVFPELIVIGGVIFLAISLVLFGIQILKYSNTTSNLQLGF